MGKKEYFMEIQRELLAKKKQLSILVKKQPSVIGNYAEEIIMDFLKDKVRNLKVGKGIITNFEHSSAQCDIILYNELYQSPILHNFMEEISSRCR